MPTFYDYDFLVGRDGNERYLLRANGKRLPVGSCLIEPFTDGTGRWQRRTQWHSTAGRRYVNFFNLDDALASGIAWAIRRTREDAR